MLIVIYSCNLNLRIAILTDYIILVLPLHPIRISGEWPDKIFVEKDI